MIGVSQRVSKVALRGGAAVLSLRFASSPSLEVEEGATYTYSGVVAGWLGMPPTLSAVTKPAWLTFTDNEDGTFSLSGTAPDILEDTDYVVVLEASHEGKTIQQSFTITVLADLAPPAAPTDFAATPLDHTQINLTWTPPDDSDLAGYQLEWSPNGVDTWTAIGGDLAGETSYQHTGLAAATAYYYRLRAYDEVPNYSAYVTASATTEAAPNVAPVVTLGEMPVGTQEGDPLEISFTITDDAAIDVENITAIATPEGGGADVPADTVTETGAVWTSAPPPGTYTIAVTYTDAGGLSGSDSGALTIEAAPPAALALIQPADSATLAAGEPITLQAEGVGNDVEFFAVKVA